MKWNTYDFMITAQKQKAYIVADQQGNSFYLPKEIKKHLPERLHMGDLIHVTTSEKLEFTERPATNSIICHGQIHAAVAGSAVNGATARVLVSSTAYGSILLTEPHTRKDYLIFTSYLSEGYQTPGIRWNMVTEGNMIRFLLFGNMPVMPAPGKYRTSGLFRMPLRIR